MGVVRNFLRAAQDATVGPMYCTVVRLRFAPWFVFYDRVSDADQGSRAKVVIITDCVFELAVERPVADGLEAALRDVCVVN